MNVKIVANRSFRFFILTAPEFIASKCLGRISAVRLSPYRGNDFIIPTRICDRNAVAYCSGSQPSLRNRYLTCVSYPKDVEDADIVGFNTKVVIKMPTVDLFLKLTYRNVSQIRL